jgi:hypothetical protein
MDKRTKDFLALPREKQRVAIAKDVLEQLRLEHFVANGGSYKTIHYESGKELWNFPLEKSMQTVLKEQAQTCYVCARGAILLSTIRKGNECTVEDFKYNSDYENGNMIERKHFHSTELSSIERVFENWDNCNKEEQKFADFLTEKASGFGYAEKSNLSQRIRLAGICRNIVENDGNWQPEKMVKKFPDWL